MEAISLGGPPAEQRAWKVDVAMPRLAAARASANCAHFSQSVHLVVSQVQLCPPKLVPLQWGTENGRGQRGRQDCGPLLPDCALWWCPRSRKGG